MSLLLLLFFYFLITCETINGFFFLFSFSLSVYHHLHLIKKCYTTAFKGRIALGDGLFVLGRHSSLFNDIHLFLSRVPSDLRVPNSNDDDDDQLSLNISLLLKLFDIERIDMHLVRSMMQWAASGDDSMPIICVQIRREYRSHLMLPSHIELRWIFEPFERKSRKNNTRTMDISSRHPTISFYPSFDSILFLNLDHSVFSFDDVINQQLSINYYVHSNSVDEHFSQSFGAS